MLHLASRSTIGKKWLFELRIRELKNGGVRAFIPCELREINFPTTNYWV
ncbi:MAG: hypothetical protein RL329_2263 [Bacteroidota bacterium]